MVGAFRTAWIKIIIPVRESAGFLERASSDSSRPDPSKLNNTPLEDVWNDFIREWKKGALTIDGQQWGVVKGSEVFDPDNLLPRITNPNYLMAVPSLMTGLGLLGTFIGLVMGISALDLTGAENLMTGIRALLGGTKVAFSTSLTGIFLALLWGHLERIALHDLGIAAARFSDRIDTSFPSLSQSQLTARLILLASSPSSTPEGALLQATVRLTEAVNSIGNKQAEASEKAARETSAMLGKALNEAIATPLQAATETLRGLETWHEKVLNTLAETSDAMDSAARRIEAAVGQSRVASVEMAEEVQSMRRDMKTREEAISLAMRTLSDNADRFERVRDSITLLSDRHIVQLERSVDGMAAQADLMRATADRNAGLLGEFWSSAGNSLEKSVDQGIAPLVAGLSSLGESLKSVTEIELAASREIDRASQALKESIKGFSAGIDTGVKRYFQNFDSNIDEICTKIAAMAKRTSTASEEMTVSIEKFKELFTSHINMMDQKLESMSSSYKPGLMERIGKALGRSERKN
jgi:ABC-type transporter Mla subunit MlaD